MRTLRRLVSAAAFCISANAAAQSAQPQPSADQLQKAAQAFGRSDWPEVLRQYSDIALRFPTHALSRFRVGVAQLELGKLVEAEQSIREGERLGVAPGSAGLWGSLIPAGGELTPRRDEPVSPR